jgi:hypothetical protein
MRLAAPFANGEIDFLSIALNSEHHKNFDGTMKKMKCHS